MKIYELEMKKLDNVEPGQFVQIKVPLPEIAECLNVIPKKRFMLIQIIQSPLDMPVILFQRIEESKPEKEKEGPKAKGKEGDK